MYDLLKEKVLNANLDLPLNDLVKLTWGNVSQVNRALNVFAIKPSGVPYEKLKKEDIVVCDLEGNIVEGNLNPSSDMKTHAYLYRNTEVDAVCHTHSTWATAYAQSGKDVEVYGTTHADSFYGSIPCARYLTAEEVEDDYELNTGKVIVETIKSKSIDYLSMPGILLHGHAPFTWGKDAKEAVTNSLILEEVCKMNILTKIIETNPEKLPEHISEKHYQRKHGKNAYYGQD